MKKILISFLLVFCSFAAFSQQTPLSTILTWFEDFDKPNESQFRIAWANSYNSVSDGLFNLTGYPSISFAPYTSMSVGKFFQAVGYPTDTTQSLGYNGIFKVSKLYVGGQLVTSGGGGFWTKVGSDLHPTSVLSNLAIRSNSAYGYNFYVNGTAYAEQSIGTNRLELFSTLDDEGQVSIDAFGNMIFSDKFITTPATLSQLLSGGAWVKSNGVLSYPDSVSIGQSPGVKDSVFNVYGTMYVEGATHFRMPVEADSGLVTDDYIQTPTVNLSYGASSGRMDLYDGRIKFYDVDHPTGVTLNGLGSGYFTKTGSNIKLALNTDNLLIGGAVANPLFDLSVSGGSLFGAQSVFMGGISMGYGAKIQFTNGDIYYGPKGLMFNDPFAGPQSLKELAGVYTDSISASLINTDTLYWNGSVTKKIFSPGTNNLFVQIDTAQWRFESFNTGSAYQPVFHTNALQMDAIADAIQANPGWEQQGKMYLSSLDTVWTYATGKPGEWRKLASETYVTNALSGLGGVTLSLDTLYFNSNIDYLTGHGSHDIEFATTTPGGQPLFFGTGVTPNISSNSNTILFNSSYMALNHGAGTYYFNGTEFYNTTDTLATKAYSRANGSGGGGGSSSFDLTINPDAAPDTFLTYMSGAFGYFATKLFTSSTSFLHGYGGTIDSVNIGKQLSMINAYTTETNLKYGFKSQLSYAGGYLNGYSKLWTNYSDADANSGKLYGIYSHTYTDDNFSSTGNTSYSNAGRFILQNRGTTSIGGASAGTTYLNAVYGEITGTIDSTATPGTYRLTAIYGKNSNIGTAKTYAGYFDGNVKTVGNETITGNIISSVLRTNSATKLAGYWDNGSSAPTDVNRLNYDGYLYATSFYGIGTNLTALNASNLSSGTVDVARGVASGSATASFLKYNGTTAADANLYGGTTDPSTTTRLNYGGNFHANNLYAVTDLKSAVINTSNSTKTAGNFYTGTSSPSNTNRINYDGAIHVTSLYNYGSFYYSKYAALTDTFALVLYPGGIVDTASLTTVSSGGGGGTGTIEGTLLDTQIAFGTALNTIGGNSSFRFTGSTKTAGAFYTGTVNPSNANRFNFDGDWYVNNIYATANLHSSVINTNGGTISAGTFYTGASNPVSPNRVNFDGNFYVTNLFATTDLRSSVINTSGTTKTAGYFFTGTTNPSNTNRLNFDGDFYSTNINAIANLKSAVINTNSGTRLAGNFYTGTTDPSATNRTNYDGNFYVTNLFASMDIRGVVLNTSGGTRTAGYFYNGLSDPTSSNRLNFDGRLYVRRLVSTDSIGATYVGTAGYTRYAAWSHTGYLYADSTHLSAFALDMPLPTTKEMLERGNNGEMQWFVKDNGEIKKTTDFGHLPLGGQIGALMASSELQLRHIAELEKKIANLEKQSRKRRR
jgi:hypothetical protein